jgi:hypothetical protein
MSETIEIYGSKIKLPPQPKHEDIWGHDLPEEQQMWTRVELPESFNKVDKDSNGDVVLTPEQEVFADRELERCRNGFWFYCKGKPTYITGKHYFYLTWWTLENGAKPDYRDTDRRYFLFLNYWENILWCLGIIRGKKRREGASSQATSNLVYECIFYKNSNCGLVSKTKEDSSETFTEMVAFGYRLLPIFLKPKQINNEDSVTKLEFAHKDASGDWKAKKSKITFRAPVLNAYDRGRMSRLLLDEFGKLPKDVPASKLFGIIAKTLVRGVKRVGFAEMPSTVNELTKSGGAEFQKIWKVANQFKRSNTPNKLVRYMTPAYDGFEGFIDQYGYSVIDAPTQEQYDYLVSKWVVRDEDGNLVSELSEDDVKLGAKHYVLIKRREGLEGEDLEEEIRMNPCDEEEMFMSALTDAVFDSVAIKKRQKELEDAPIYKRKILFYRNLDGVVSFRDVGDKESYHWRITQLPPKGEENKKKIIDGNVHPGRTHDGAMSVDSYSNTQGGRKYGSKASAWIGRKYDVLLPNETGKPIGHLYGRPTEKNILHEQVLLAAEYYGYRVWYEHVADDYYNFFKDRGRKNYLGRYPLSLIPPEKKGKDSLERHFGTPTSPFSLTKQLDNAVSYFRHHCSKIDFEELLEWALIFEADDRTAYDCVVSFLILVTVLTEPDMLPPPRKEPLLKTYP